MVLHDARNRPKDCPLNPPVSDVQYSNEFRWIPSRTGAVEYFGSQTCEVNISVLKLMLAEEEWPVLPRTLSDIEYDEASGKLVLGQKGERVVRREVVAQADVSLPLVAAFLPIARHALNGTALWGTDIVDGFHRLAAAKVRGLTEMPLVLAPPLPSAIVTKPNAMFNGAIAQESDFLMFNPAVREPSFYAALTSHVGKRFAYGVVED